jgi:hypothetical protein
VSERRREQQQRARERTADTEMWARATARGLKNSGSAWTQLGSLPMLGRNRELLGRPKAGLLAGVTRTEAEPSAVEVTAACAAAPACRRNWIRNAEQSGLERGAGGSSEEQVDRSTGRGG